MDKQNSFQVQPFFAEREAWAALAGRENLQFEILELSGPSVLGKSRRPENCYIEWLQENSLVRSLHGCYIDVNPASGDILFQELSRLRIKESCDIALQLNADNVVIHSSCATFLRGGYLDHWAAVSAEYFEGLAEEYPLNIFIENSMDIDTTPLMELMKHIKNPRIGVCLDIGHANYSRDPLEKWFSDLGDYIGYIHLSDNMGFFDDHLPLGKGKVDWDKTDRFCRGLGKNLIYTLETGSLEDTERSIRFLKDRGYFEMEG